MCRTYKRHLLAAFALAVLQGCGVPDEYGEAACVAEPDFRIATYGAGAEDLVRLQQDAEAPSTRFIVREIEGGLAGRFTECDSDHCRLGWIDIDEETEGGQTDLAWRPPSSFETFHPLGMSLVQDKDDPDKATLYLIDVGEPTRLWKLDVEDGLIEMADDDAPWFPGNDDDVLQSANNLQVVGDRVYVTRFNKMGWAPWRSDGWRGLVELREGQPPRLREKGFHGANGIVDPGGDDLVVADYWNRRLRLVSKDEKPGDPIRFASAVLPFRPDNLTLDGDRILVAGQRSTVLTALSLALPFVPSPSAVMAFSKDQLKADEPGEMLWWSGTYDGRSISVAAPAPNGLVLGQIRAADLLHVRCL